MNITFPYSFVDFATADKSRGNNKLRFFLPLVEIASSAGVRQMGIKRPALLYCAWN